MLASLCPPAPFSIASASYSAETGTFRFVFETHEALVSADLTVAWLEEQNLAWLRFILVDRVRTRDRALASLVEAWVADNQQLVFGAALEAV